MKFYLLPFVCFTFATQCAWSSPLKEKFSDLVSTISSELKSYSDKTEDLDTLAGGSLRQSLFTIQTLSDLYSPEYDGFDLIRIKTKSLEDSIGAYRKTIEQLDYAVAAGASQDKIKKLTALKSQEALNLKSFLESYWTEKANGEKSESLKQISTVLEKIKWKTDSEDQKYTYGAISQQITDIDQTQWNMNVLEGGGIHDLRKAVRWYRLELAALPDLISTQNNTCGEGAIVPSHPNSQGKCLISDCLNQHMGKIYSVFGAIKDEGEGQAGVGGDLDKEKFKVAQDLYQETKTKNIFSKLASELKSCEGDIK